jgi:inner membrane protein involved in colicin E2 resistance
MNPLLVKMLIIVLLTLVLLVPLGRVESLIAERDTAVERVAKGYSLLHLLVLSEDYALLFGALAIFFLLATIMIGTRKLDWYRIAESQRLKA